MLLAQARLNIAHACVATVVHTCVKVHVCRGQRRHAQQCASPSAAVRTLATLRFFAGRPSMPLAFPGAFVTAASEPGADAALSAASRPRIRRERRGFIVSGGTRSGIVRRRALRILALALKAAEPCPQALSISSSLTQPLQTRKQSRISRRIVWPANVQTVSVKTEGGSSQRRSAASRVAAPTSSLELVCDALT